MKTKEELKAIIETAKEMGMPKVEVDGVTYTLPELKAVTQNVPEMSAEDIINPMSVLDEMDEEEIKYWSSNYYDELMAQKERQRNLTAEEKADE